MSDTVYLFHYDGTPMTFTCDKGGDYMFQAFEEIIPKMMAEFKTKDKVVDVMLRELEIHAKRLYEIAGEDGMVNVKNMRKAWGKNWINHQMMWCIHVHCASILRPSLVNDKFGVMMVTNAKKAFGKDYRDYKMTECATCHNRDVKQKKCGRCEAVHYCSPECQKAHWKTHKLTCVPLTK
jgi:hypothetical protein